MRKTASIFISFVLFVSCYGEDLESIYEKAKQNDPVFGIAKQNLLAAREKPSQAVAGLLPTINLNINSNQQKGRSSFNYGEYATRDVYSWGASLQLTQPIIRAQNWLTYKQALTQEEQAEADFLKAEQELILRVTQAYFDVLTAQENISAYEMQLKAVETQLETAKKNYAAGITTITDIHESESRKDITDYAFIAAKKDYEDKKAILEQIVGFEIVALAPLSDSAIIKKPTPENPQEWADTAIKNGVTVKSLQKALDGAKAELWKNRAGHLPTLDLTASYGENLASGSLSSPSDIKSRYKAGQVGFTLSMPIYSGGLTNSKVQESIIAVQKATLELENAKRQAISTAKQYYLGVQSGISQIKALKSAVANSAKSVDANKIGYKLGVRINTDVLNAEQQLANTKRDFAKIRYETVLYSLKLKSSIGALTQTDLSDVNRLLDKKQ